MRAQLGPLEGKYYGTKVVIEDETNFSGGWVMIWIMGDYEPSRRELEGYELQEDGRWTITVEDEGETYIDEYEICDSHYETKDALRIAELLVEAVNNESTHQA